MTSTAARVAVWRPRWSRRPMPGRRGQRGSRSRRSGGDGARRRPSRGTCLNHSPPPGPDDPARRRIQRNTHPDSWRVNEVAPAASYCSICSTQRCLDLPGIGRPRIKERTGRGETLTRPGRGAGRGARGREQGSGGDAGENKCADGVDDAEGGGLLVYDMREPPIWL